MYPLEIRGNVWRDSTARKGVRASVRAGVIVPVSLILGCTNPLAPEQDDLSSARVKWSAAEIEDYSYVLRRLCFCGPNALRAVRIVVEAGEVTSATYVESEEPVTDYPFGEIPTIDALFAEIQAAIDQDAASLEATYDFELGYPVFVSIDFSLNVADEEMGFEVSGFESNDAEE